MTVQDVNTPPRLRIEDAKDVKPKSQDDAEYWEKHKTVIRARREALQEEQELKNLQNPPPAEPPAFQVKGSINVGDINVLEEQKRLREEADKARLDATAREETARQEAAVREKELSTKLEASRGELAEAKMTAAMEKLGAQFLAAVKGMDQKIDQVAKGADPSSLTAYIDSLEKLATKMGYQRGGDATVGDPRIAIELQKMKAEEAARERAFQLDMKKFEFEMQRQGRKDVAEIEIKKEELEAKKKRDEMFASAPEMVGRAIARGMMEEGSSAPVLKKQVSTNGKIKGRVTAARGEAGEVDCPQCGQPIVIGPTANAATCAGCNLSVSVDRVEKQIAQSEADMVSEPEDEERIGGR